MKTQWKKTRLAQSSWLPFLRRCTLMKVAWNSFDACYLEGTAPLLAMAVSPCCVKQHILWHVVTTEVISEMARWTWFFWTWHKHSGWQTSRPEDELKAFSCCKLSLAKSTQMREDFREIFQANSPETKQNLQMPNSCGLGLASVIH